MFVELFPTRQLRLVAGALYDACGQPLAWVDLPDKAFREGMCAGDDTRRQALQRIGDRLTKIGGYSFTISEADRTATLKLQ